MAYLDHAATTPMVQASIDAMDAAFRVVGNASALHAAGRDARRIVEESRERIADAVHCLPGEVVFTSGGTEADNLAIKGLFWARRAADECRQRVLVSSIEHHAVLDPALWLARSEGAHVEELAVDGSGVLDLAVLRTAVEEHAAEVALVSAMWANNEVGSLQPIDEVVAIARAAGIPVHSDAVQALGAVPLDFAASGLAAMTISAHKVGGPVGIGALLLQRDLKPTPVLHGGGQEREVRSGTIPMPLIAGMAAAVELAVAGQAAHAQRLASLRDRLIAGVLALGLGAELRGHPAQRLPGNAHFTFDGCEGDALLMLLDAAGVQVSTGSACTAGIPQPSHVLLAMGIPESVARGALRFSLGRSTMEADIDAAIAALPDAVDRARRAGMMRR